MADLATQHIVAAGTAPTYATPTASTGDTVEIGSGTNSFLHVVNASVDTPTTVTLSSDLTLDSGADYPDKDVVVAFGTEAWIPLIKDYSDANAGAGRATVVCSSVSDVTIAAVRRS